MQIVDSFLPTDASGECGFVVALACRERFHKRAAQNTAIR